MKKIKLQSIAVVLMLVTFLSSCSSDNNTPDTSDVIFKSSFATDVNGPTTGKVNQELTYVISFEVENSCGEFQRFTDVEFKKEPGFQIEAKYPKAGCESSTPTIKRTTYKITPTLKGTYYLRIAKSDSEYIETKVVID
ncbi:hypothetical protein [Flavobacterium johnsoniae]|jgi:hypothetical protein|uniref:Lipoprotein n=1 Tax=Flavobacterium johnsoniae TaxID=986 RepID=A0A1M5MGK2_FLAJO|nr:hypothetical protein [Flavobacterium johnsoniae]SHG76321.1 hypothetical protein SAMN05444388_104166 [Flavobacterium johnsoniae]